MTAPALSVIERIAEVIATRLRAIKMAAGYSFDVGDVVRPTRTGGMDTPRHLSIILEQAGNQYNEELTCSGNPPAIAWNATFNINCFVRESDKSDVAHSTGENEMHAAVIKAIAGTMGWYHMDQLAIISDWGDQQPYITSTGDHAGITLPLIVTYRVSEDDPTEVRM